jgi:hypothetical protein
MIRAELKFDLRSGSIFHERCLENLQGTQASRMKPPSVKEQAPVWALIRYCLHTLLSCEKFSLVLVNPEEGNFVGLYAPTKVVYIFNFYAYIFIKLTGLIFSMRVKAIPLCLLIRSAPISTRIFFPTKSYVIYS